MILLILALIAGGAALAGLKWFEAKITSPGPMAGSEDQIVFVPRGSGVSSIGQRLEEAGLIDDARLFRLAARFEQVDADLKAGEYLVPADSSMVDILELMASGKVLLHNLTIVEGSTVAQAMRAIETADFLTGDMPETPPEGSLLPETHAFTRGTTRAEVVEMFKTYQDNLLDEIWDARAEGLPIDSREDAIILASIVEKETGSVGDEDLVASVFVNRLKLGMRLQSDPTIIYGISKGERLMRTLPDGREVQRGLFRSEIDRVTPYNTYQVDGLPPTPICNPSEAALRAVLQPAESDYLFFVADGSGNHAFSRTNAEHNRNVARWRQIEAERRRAEQGG